LIVGCCLVVGGGCLMCGIVGILFSEFGLFGELFVKMCEVMCYCGVYGDDFGEWFCFVGGVDCWVDVVVF